MSLNRHNPPTMSTNELLTEIERRLAILEQKLETGITAVGQERQKAA